MADHKSRSGLSAHLQQLRREYARRRDAMIEALARHFPSEARWNRPQSGFYVWLELPRPIDASQRKA